MPYFKAALTEIGGENVAIIWLDKKYLTQEKEIQKQIDFFKDLLDCPNTVAMIQEGEEQPKYFGKPTITKLLQMHFWKKFPWKSYELAKSTT